MSDIEVQIIEDTPINIEISGSGIAGQPGQGVPTGGTAGQILTKDTTTDFDTSWQDPTGAVDSVNGQTGTVVLDQDDIADGTTYKQFSATEKIKLSGAAELNSASLLKKEQRPKFQATDSTVIDGDDYRGADGLNVTRATFAGTTYLDGVSPAGGAGSSIIKDNRLVWGKTDGTFGNTSGGASYAVARTFTVVPDFFAMSYRISSLTSQGAAATTDGASGGIINTSNPDSQTDGYNMVLHGAVHLAIGKSTYSFGIFDGIHTAGLVMFTQNGVNLQANLTNPLSYDVDYTVTMMKMGNRILVRLPGDNGYIITDPDSRVNTYWGSNLIIEPYQPVATYATDHAIQYNSWIAKKEGNKELLETAALASIPRNTTTNAMDANYLPTFMSPFLDWALVLPGTTGSYVSTPDSAANSITGDIDIRVKVKPTTTRPAVAQTLLAKAVVAGSQYSYIMQLGTTGGLILYWSETGTSGTLKVAGSNAVIPNPQSTPIWLRVTLDVDNGASGRDIKFWTSSDNVAYTQLGTTITQATTTSIFNSTSPVEIGSYANGTLSPFSGAVYNAEIRNGIGGSVVASYAPNNLSTYTAPTTEVWTVNGMSATTSILLSTGFKDGLLPSLTSELAAKQDTLVSGTNIKTVNGTTVLGSGDIAVANGIDWTLVAIMGGL